MFKRIEEPTRPATQEERALLVSDKSQQYREFLRRTQEEAYAPWSRARHIARELDLPAEAAWEQLSLQRSAFRSIITPIRTQAGNHFCFGIQNAFWAFAHQLDQNYCGKDTVAEDMTDERHRYLVEGIMEEAIASSQLEGAKTARSQAIALLKSGRAAQSDDEKMIVNNFKAMQAVEERLVRDDLSVASLLEMHSILTSGLKDDSGEVPHLRGADEPISVIDKITGDVYHEGPPAAFVREELQRLCDFANSSGNDAGHAFTHPFIKAVELHFWLGYLHPFTDGNGRLARLLFYWFLIKRGYWAAAFLPISQVIKNAREEYPRAYQLSEQDSYDLTYFIDFNVRKMAEAMRNFEEHRKKTEMRLERRHEELRKYVLNPRQLSVMDYLIRHPEQSVSVRSHMLLARVSRPTAINDLRELVGSRLLIKVRSGREIRYELAARSGR